MGEGLGFARRRLVDKIINDNWKLESPIIKNFSYNELLYIIQEMLTDEGKQYLESRSSPLMGHHIFKMFVKHLLYRNLANYDSMVLITSEKGCITSDSLIEMPGYGKSRKVLVTELLNKKDFFVYSFNLQTKKIELKKAKKCEFVKVDCVYELELISGQKLKATFDHPMLLTNGTYKKLIDIDQNDKLQLLKGEGVIKSIKYLGKQKVYDVVGVEDNHNFIANGFVVSNTGKSSTAIAIGREWCKLIGIRFNPNRHIAYNNIDVQNKITILNKFEPLICLPKNTYIRIKYKDKEYNEVIQKLVNKNDFEVLTYNIKEDIFEWKKPEKVILTKEDTIDTIELDNGIKIQATSNHLFLTKNGIYKKLNELTENDELVLNTKKCIECGKEFFNVFQYAIICSEECRLKHYKKNQYRLKYPKKEKIWRRNYWKKKFYSDITFRLRHNLKTRMSHAIRKTNKNYNKEISFLKLLGCNYEQLKLHLEKQFKKDMNWNNYGKIWSVDHIIPVFLFNLLDVEQRKKCFHYNNLQPLYRKENCSKGRWTK